MTWPKQLDLVAWAPKFEGVGERLTLVVSAGRKHAGGVYAWRGDVRLSVDRWFVRQIAQAIADMQTADRMRIREELARLDDEVEPLTRPTTKDKP
jgi:hypothetical protein